MTPGLDNKSHENKNDFRGWNLDSVPTFLYAAQNLQSLYLANNNIEQLPADLFGHFPHLRWFDLRNNKLRTFPTTVKNHRTLETLLLDDNQLSALPMELGAVSTLKGLQVTNNPLEYPPERIVRKGVQHLIRFLREEWNNRDEKKSSRVESIVPGWRTDIYIENMECNSEETFLPLRLKRKKNVTKKISSRRIKSAKTPLLAIEHYVRVKKLLKAKPETKLNLFEYWDQLTPSHLMEKLSYSHLAKYERKEGESQSSFRPLATPSNIQHGNTFIIPNRVKYRKKRRILPRKPLGDKLRSKDDFERDVHDRHLESLRRLQRKLTLETQERILQRGKTREALRNWRLKSKKLTRRDSRSQMRKILRHDQDFDRNHAAGGRTSSEDFLRKLDSVREKFQKLTLERLRGGESSLEVEQKFAEQRLNMILNIQRDLKELKRKVQ
ncbi:unnamed protein product [Bemisia tabaci]|uniref:Leucine-rich repeat-containing protein 27 n=1 Tax=Bemisia tabaci TaxID=7038 RepID=A0A9P0AL30_BEMTA|nr:unnamed protein product [Bemisia tabaci]